MSKSLIFAHFLFFGERYEWIAHFAQIIWAMWANRSFRLPKMSDHEWFAQVRKWAMWANRSFRSNQMSDVSESLILLNKNEWPWAIPSGRSEEMSDVSELLILLTKIERMSESLIFLSESLIHSFMDKNERFARKSNERIPSPIKY